MNYVEKYIEDSFAVELFTIEDIPGYFQGKKVADAHGESLIIEGLPFTNAVLVHLDGEITKYIHDEKNKVWVEDSVV